MLRTFLLPIKNPVPLSALPIPQISHSVPLIPPSLASPRFYETRGSRRFTMQSSDKPNQAEKTTTTEEDVRSRGLYVPYTRGGDGGTTRLMSKSGCDMVTIGKSSAVVDCIGSVDELCSVVGLLHEVIKREKGEEDGNLGVVEDVVMRLMDVGCIVGSCYKFVKVDDDKNSNDDDCGDDKEFNANTHKLPTSSITSLESSINEHTISLPPLRNFVLPVNCGVISGHCHVARSVARRAERDYVKFLNLHLPCCGSDEYEGSAREVGVYLNRVSDYFFTLARVYAEEEVVFRKGKEGRREGVKRVG